MVVRLIEGLLTGFFMGLIVWIGQAIKNKRQRRKQERAEANIAYSEQFETEATSEETKRLFEAAREKERSAMEARKKDEDAKRKLKMRKVVCAFAVLLCIFTVAFVIIPYSDLQTANRTFNSGRFEEAYKLYDALSSNVFFREQADLGKKNCRYRTADNAFFDRKYDEAISIYIELGDEEKVKNIRIVAADEALRNGEYKSAAEMYEILNEEQKAKDAWRAYGDLCISAKEYEEAIETFEKLQDSERVLQSRRAWADSLMDQHRYQEAAEQYRLCNLETRAHEVIYSYANHLLDTGKAADVPIQLQGYCGEQIAQFVFDAAKVNARSEPSSSIDEIAGEYGSYITDVNTQLAYCNLLRNEGVDLKKAYPNGVKVNVDLSRFQLFDYLYTPAEERISNPDCSKMLVFSRTEEKPVLVALTESSQVEEADFITESEGKRKRSTDLYTVRLQPAMMDAIPERMRANTLEECSGVLLLEKGYYSRNGIVIQAENTYSYDNIRNGALNNKSTYEIYAEYTAYEGILVYDAHNPLNLLCYDYYYNDPVIYRKVIGNSNVNLNMSSEEIDEILLALENKDSASSALILGKYPQNIIDFLTSGEWGHYMYIPEEDEHGNQIGQTYSFDDVNAWYTEKHMLGVYDDGWMEKQLANEAVEKTVSYILSHK